MNTYKKYYIFSVIGAFLACSYPIYMGIRVVSDMITNGTVQAENYPKYIIPYTPISIALLLAVILMPLAIKYLKRLSLPCITAVSLGTFFVSELMFENMVLVAKTTENVKTVITTIETWQMYMCAYFPPTVKTEEVIESVTEVDKLIGDYSPAFKMHFYVISLILIICFINCFHGFAVMIKENNYKRLKPLILQAVSCLLFLGLCIFACFTAFFRTGTIQISALSAFLMCVFFVIMGVTVGIYLGSFFMGKNKLLSVVIPSVTASLITVVMYIGEMILLDGNLYRFGTGFFFDPIPGIVLSLADIAIILLSGAVTALILKLVCGKKQSAEIAAQGE